MMNVMKRACMSIVLPCLLLITFFAIGGCDEELDLTPPADVTGITVIPGDGFLEIVWLDPVDVDLFYIQIVAAADDTSGLQVDSGVQTVLFHGLPNQTQSELILYAVDFSGNRSVGVSATGTPNGSVLDTAAAGPVSGLTATAANAQISLVWTDPADSDLDLIEITHDRTNGADPFYVQPGRQALVMGGLINHTEYTFSVVTVDLVGNRSTAATVAVTPFASIDVTAPGPVTATTIAALDASVHIVWTDPPDIDLGRVAVRSTEAGSPSVYVDSGVEEIVIGGLENWVLYEFTVTAYDETGNASASELVSATPRKDGDLVPPGPVSGEVAAPGNRQILITWTDPGDVDLDKIEITWFDGAAESAPLYVDPGTQRMLIAGVDNYVLYTITITVLDGSGNRSTPVTIDPVEPFGDTIPPATVTGVVHSVGDGFVDIDWVDPVDADLDQIEIAWTDGAAAGGAIFTNQGVRTARVCGLANGVEHTFTLTAVDLSGNRSDPPVVFSDTPDEKAGFQDQIAAAVIFEGDESVILTWTDPTGIENEEFHHVRIIQDPPVGSALVIIPAGIEMAVVGGLINDTVYSFSLTAVNNHGSEYSPAATLTGTPSHSVDSDPPGAVTFLALSVAPDGLFLTWIDPFESDFGYVAITHDRTGGSEPVYVFKGRQQARIVGLVDDGTHVFSIVAYDAAGNPSATETVAGLPDLVSPAPINAVDITIVPSGTDSLKVSWPAAAESDFSHWTLTSTIPGGASLMRLSSATTSIVAVGLNPGTSYDFTFVSVDLAWNESAPVTVSGIPPVLDLLAPGEVAGLSSSAGFNSVTLSWSALPADSDYEHLEITHTGPGGAQPIILMPPSGPYSVTIVDLAPAASYDFLVRTVDIAGNISGGAAITDGPPPIDIIAPGEVANQQSTANGSNYITISWDNPVDADLHHIEITHDGNNGGTPLVLTTDIQTVTLVNLDNGVLCTVTIKTVDEDDNISTGVTVGDTPASTDDVPPAEATGLSISVGNERAVLHWTDPLDPDLRYVNITHDRAGGTVPLVLGYGIEEAFLTGLTNGVGHWFTIRTEDYGGNESAGVSIYGVPNPEEDLTLTYTLNPPGEITSVLSGTVPVINRTSSEFMTVTVNAAGAVSFVWFIDGTSYNDDNVRSIYASLYSPGQHILKIVFTVNGQRYVTDDFVFTVTN